MRLPLLIRAFALSLVALVSLVLCPAYSKEAPDTLAAEEAAPAAFTLHAPAPNPMRGPSAVRYDLPGGASVRLAVYDVLGREVVRLEDGPRGAGQHRVPLDASALAPGVYVVRIEAGTRVASHRLTVVR